MVWYVYLGCVLGGLVALGLIILACCWRCICPKSCQDSDTKNIVQLGIGEQVSVHNKNDYLKQEVPTGGGVVRDSQAGPADLEEPTDSSVIKMLEKAAAERVLSSVIIDSERLNLGEVIGHGQFGVVYKGMLLEPQSGEEIAVAVKTVQGSALSEKEAASFMEEVLLMRGLHHRNVLGFLGLVLRDNQPYAIMPYMHNGNLKDYISHRDRNFSVEDLLGFGVQIADGMEYLESQKFVHRDLAARNCMVDKDQTVAVADFGLSRDIFTSDYYRVADTSIPLPVRWMAPESLEQSGKFSYKSDVWSFGVVLWELMTRGMTPYPKMDNAEVLQHIKAGKYMARPQHAPPEIYNVMTICWKTDPFLRPTFTKLAELLRDLLKGKTAQVDGYLAPVTTATMVTETPRGKKYKKKHKA